MHYVEVLRVEKIGFSRAQERVRGCWSSSGVSRAFQGVGLRAGRTVGFPDFGGRFGAYSLEGFGRLGFFPGGVWGSRALRLWKGEGVRL